MRGKCFCFLLIASFLVASLYAQQADELIIQGDKLYEEMKDMATAKEALSKYQDALQMLENKFEVFWRISRLHYYIGIHTETNDEKKIVFSQGKYYADKAINLEPERPEGHYWQGVNNGKYGESRGVLKSLFLVKPIKKAMNKVVELDESFEGGGAHRVLGRMYYKLPGFAGGSKKKSKEHLLKSLEFGPEDALTRLYLAETYIEMKDIEKAKEQLDYILAMEDDPCWVPQIMESKEEARKILQKKEFKK